MYELLDTPENRAASERYACPLVVDALNGILEIVDRLRQGMHRTSSSRAEAGAIIEVRDFAPIFLVELELVRGSTDVGFKVVEKDKPMTFVEFCQRLKQIDSETC